MYTHIIHIHTYIYAYIYIYMCIYQKLCARYRERPVSPRILRIPPGDHPGIMGWSATMMVLHTKNTSFEFALMSFYDSL